MYRINICFSLGMLIKGSYMKVYQCFMKIVGYQWLYTYDFKMRLIMLGIHQPYVTINVPFKKYHFVYVQC